MITIGKKNERRWKLYCHTNLINGKLYFGITSTSLERRYQTSKGYKGCPLFHRAIKKYGWENFKHEIIYDGLTKEEAEEAEQIYIAFFRTQDHNIGYNVQSGGSCSGEVSEDGRQRLIEAASGKNSKIAKPLVVFDINGNKVEELHSIHEASVKYNSTIIHKNSALHSRAVNGCFFRLKSIVGDSTVMSEDDLLNSPTKVLPKNFGYAHCRSVTMFDKLTGKKIKTFSRLKDVLDLFEIEGSHIWKKGFLTSDKYVFMFTDSVKDVDVLNLDFLNPKPNVKAKSVNQYDLNGELICTFSSLSSASKELGLSYKSMSSCANHKCQSSGGFVWRYVDDPVQFVQPRTCTESRKLNNSYPYKPVDQIDLNSGNVICTFRSVTDAAEHFNVTSASISSVARHVGNCKSAAGFGWEFHRE